MRKAKSALAIACLSLLCLAAVGGEAAWADTPPSPSLEAASAITYKSAHLAGHVNPNGGPSTTLWQIQTSTSGEEGSWQLAGAGQFSGIEAEETVPMAVSANVTGLKPGTTYLVRLIAINQGGANQSIAQGSFQTLTQTAPSVSLDPVSTYTAKNAQLSGHINPNSPEPKPASAEVESLFELKFYVVCTPFCQPSSTLPASGALVADNASTAVGSKVVQLVPGTEYEVNLIAERADGVQVTSAPQTFTTPPTAPTIDSTSVSEITQTSARLEALIRPGGEPATYRFQYVSEEQFQLSQFDDATETVESDPIGSDSGPHEVAAQINALEPATAYRFRVVATNSVGETTGVTRALKTQATPGTPTSGEFPGQGFLPDNRAWEMVSPPEKNGGGVVPDSGRVRAGADGGAIGFTALTGFGQVIGSGVATDYVSVRSANANPGDNGWDTHPITPSQDPNTLITILSQLEPLYVGEFSDDLNRGVFLAKSVIGDDPYVSGVLNLYLRDDLRKAGAGSYQLLTRCPRCEDLQQPLPSVPNSTEALLLKPLLLTTSRDFDYVFFDSNQRLTLDTPSQQAGRWYEWHDGEVRLASKVPSGAATSCDDVNGPACVAASPSSYVDSYVPTIFSDGSDGHRRLFFTVPTSAQTNFDGNFYMRVDGEETIKINVPEPGAPAEGFSPARFQGSTADGSRAFFFTKQPLTEDAPADGQAKLYMVEPGKPASERLTLLASDHEEADGGEVKGVIGTSDDGEYVYFLAQGQLLADEPLLNERMGIYLWHDGAVRYVGPSMSQLEELLSSGRNLVLSPRQARVTPDGKHMLFSAISGEGLLSRYGGSDYDHGSCEMSLGNGCRELYAYDAELNSLQCASCNPNGATATTPSSVPVRNLSGGSQSSTHEPTALSEDGRYVFFSTAERLVAQDTNSPCQSFAKAFPACTDAYVYDTSTGEVRLLSSGDSKFASYFIDATPDGSNAFVLTESALSRWDVDQAYDLYDARVDGGFPEPRPAPPSCQGDACQPPPADLADSVPGSALLAGSGNVSQRSGKRRCPKGRHKAAKHSGGRRCGKRKAFGHRARTAKHDRRTVR